MLTWISDNNHATTTTTKFLKPRIIERNRNIYIDCRSNHNVYDDNNNSKQETPPTTTSDLKCYSVFGTINTYN